MAEGGRGGEGEQDRGRPEHTPVTQPDTKLALVHPCCSVLCLPVENHWLAPT